MAIQVFQGDYDALTNFGFGNTNYIIMENLTTDKPYKVQPGASPFIMGNGKTITVTSDKWPGLFDSSVTVSNLGIISSKQLLDGAGWFFGKGVAGAAVNCYSTGPIGRPDDNGPSFIGGGGIFGAEAIGCDAKSCYSTGSIGYNAGGIFGYKTGGVAIECYSTGSIGVSSGGIFSKFAASDSLAQDCYSTGPIGAFGGGIFGANAYNSTAKNCYSIGPVGPKGGGIFGYYVSSTAINCYSTTSIFGEKADRGTLVATNCNVTTGGWSDNTASTTLTGVPVNQVPGAIWKSYLPNTPYVHVLEPQPPSTNTSLSVVSINGIIVNKSGNTYSLTLNSYRTSTSVNITSPLAAISFNGRIGSNNISETLLLDLGKNSFSISVTAQNGATKSVYKLIINNPISLSNVLSSISINGALIPNINGTYNAYNSPNVASVSITPMDTSARIQIAALSGTGNLQGQLNITNRSKFFIIVVSIGTTQYAYTLTIRKPIIDQTFINDRTPLLDNTDYLVGENLTITTYLSMTSPFTYDGSGTGITVDGSGYIITALDGSIGQFRAPDEWLGLFSKAITVKNLGIESSMNLTYGAGWFFQEGVAGSATNCHTSAAIRTYSGGIFGKAVTGGSATNCYSTGSILGGGGIFGGISVSCTATDCYSTGVIGEGGGGIFGWQTNTGTALKCYSTGSIGLGYAGERSGGIFGTSAENCSATKCYSTGKIGPMCGGIFSDGQSHNITACYSLGAFEGADNGSITTTGSFGSTTGSSITNCYGAAPLVNADPISNTLSNNYAIEGSWSDAAANSSLTGVSTVWSSAKPNTPYLLVENPEKFTSEISSVIINGETLSEPYSYRIPSLGVTTISVQITATDSRADIAIEGTLLSGSRQLSGSLTLSIGLNQNIIQVTRPDGVVTRYPLKITVPSLEAPTVTVLDSPPYNGSVGLSWTAPAGAVKYNVYRSTNNITYAKIFANIDVLTTTIGNRVNGYLYLKVSAVNRDGHEGLLSDAIPVLILFTPSAPTNLVSTSTSPGTVTLRWKSPADTGNAAITSFTVYNGNVPVVGANITLDRAGGGGTGGFGGFGGNAIIGGSVTLTGLSNNQIYTFAVTAINSRGQSPKSSSSQIILSSLSSSISSPTNFTTALTPLLTDKPNAVLNARAAINNAVKDGTLTNQQYQDLTVAAMNAINTTGGTFASVTRNTNAILATMKTVNTTSPPDTSKSVVVVIPSYSTTSPHIANIDLNTETAIVDSVTLSYANIISNAYLVFELPICTPGSEYYLTLKNGPDLLTLQYDGTVLRDQNLNKYTANDELRIGAIIIPLIGLGSIGGAPLISELIVDSIEITDLPSTIVLTTNKTSIPVNITTTAPTTEISFKNSDNEVVLSGTGTLIGTLPLVFGENTFYVVTGGSTGTFTVRNPIEGAPLINELVIDSNSITVLPDTIVLELKKSSITVNIIATVTSTEIILKNSANTVILSGTGEITGTIPIVSGDNIFYIVAGGSTYTITVRMPSNLPCFPTGTRILTADGYKKVEDLATGDLVMTADGLRVPVKIYETDLAATTTETAPFRIPKGTFGPAAPANDLILSPMHFFQIRKGLWMLPKLAAALSNKVKQIMVGSPITYYHIECPHYLRDNLVVDGTVVESFGANQLTAKPYTYNARLNGFTRVGYTKTKSITKA